MSRRERRQANRARKARSAPGKKGPTARRRARLWRFLPGRFLAPLGIGLAVAAVVAIIVMGIIQAGGGSNDSAAAAAEQDRDPNLPGQRVDPGGVYPATGDHVDGTVPLCDETATPAGAEGRPTCYGSNPPTSGPHSAQDVGWAIYDKPIPREQLVHNMEHGGVVIWYNCSDCDELVANIRKVVEGYLQDGAELVMVPYSDMEESTIALTAWSRLDKFSIGDYSEERLRRFVEAHERRFNPEGL